MSIYGDKDFVEDPVTTLINKVDKLTDEIVEQRELLGSKGIIRDGWGNGNKACVSPRGQLITAPLAFSKMYSATASVDATAVNIVIPEPGKQFVVTDIILFANRNVGANDATVSIFESDGPISSTVSGPIFTQEMLKQSTIALSGLNIIVTQGTWVNLITDDNTVFVNLGGYYVAAV